LDGFTAKLGSVDLPHEDLAAIKVGSGGNPKVRIWRN
jgi:hypothetical protein